MERYNKILGTKILVIGLLMITSQSLIAGGPWTQKKGKSYLKLSEWWLVYDQHFTDQGLIDPNTTTGIFNTNFYGEYGITNRYTAIVYAPLLYRNYTNNVVSSVNGAVLSPGEAINNIGDVDLSLKYSLNKPGSKIPMAIGLLLGFPTGVPVAGELQNLQTGDGEFNQMIQLDAGKGFKIGKLNAYTSLYAGFNHRTKGYSEEIRFGAELGMVFLKEKLWFIVRSNGVESLKNGLTAQNMSSTGIFANNTEYISIAAELNYYLTKKIGFSASFAGAFRGEIIAAAPSYSAGVFLDLSR